MSRTHRLRTAFATGWLVLLGALGIVMLHSSAADAAGWLSPLDLSPTGADAIEPDLALNEAGDAVVAWRLQEGGSSVIKARTRPPAGSFSSPVSLSSAGPAIASPEVALNATGAAVVAWRNGTSIEVATRPAGGSFSAPESIPAPGPSTSDPQVALDAAGDVVVVWLTTAGNGLTSTVETATRPAGGSFSARSPVPGAALHPVEPRLALTSAGEALVVWDAGGAIEAATRPVGGAFSAGPLSAPGVVTGEGPRLSLNPRGDAIVVWKRLGVPTPIIEAATRSAGSAFSQPVQLSAPAGNSTTPDVALNAAGDATVVWISKAVTPNLLEGVFRPARGSFTAAAALAGEAQTPSRPRVAIDAAGNAAVAWERQSGAANMVNGATRPFNDAFSAPVALSAEGQTVTDTQIALDARGDGIAVWSRSNSNNRIVQAALYEATGPRPGNPTVTPPIKPAHPKARVGRLVKLQGGKALVSLSCPTSGPCQGTVKLSAKRGAKRLALGKRSFQIEAGEKLTLAIKLSAAGRLLIDGAGRKGLVARLEGAGVQTAAVRLRGASR
jgi:hypothetical protein